MPSHIFTRLGLWDDSIASDLAARSAAENQGDTGEELHANYLVYAYLQNGRDQGAAQVIAQLKAIPNLDVGDLKIGYAATAMPVRYIVECQQWSEAEKIVARRPPVPNHRLVDRLIDNVRSRRSIRAFARDTVVQAFEELKSEGYLDVDLISAAILTASFRFGRRTTLTFPLFCPPQKNRSLPSDSSPDMTIPCGISTCSRTSPV